MKRVHVRIHGHVQGVFFRAETRSRASSLGLGGFIRNLPDGSVEAAFEGDAARVDSMLEWCRRGPSGARVERVDVEWEEPSGDDRFVVR